MNTLEMELVAAAAVSDEPRADRRVPSAQPSASSKTEAAPRHVEGALVGTLIGFKDDERTPLVAPAAGPPPPHATVWARTRAARRVRVVSGRRKRHPHHLTRRGRGACNK